MTNKKKKIKAHASTRECPICHVPHTINQHRHHGTGSYKKHHKKK